MIIGRTVVAVGGFCVAAAVLSGPPTPAAASGPVVTAVEPGGAAKAAGLRPGDVLLSWTRAPSPPSNPNAEGGTFQIPCDVTLVEVEQSPRGRITLVVVQGSRRRTLSFSRSAWGVQTRAGTPAATNDGWSRVCQLEAQARDRLRNNEPAAAAALYRTALESAEKTAPDGLAVAWLLGDLGEVEESVEDMAAARGLAMRALAIRQRLAPDSPAVAASLGALARATSDPDSAEELGARSLAMWERMAPDSLETARALNDLGAIRFQTGDVFAARSLHERAIAIATRLDPGGLEVAASLYGLGNVAWRRGDLAAADDFHQRALAIRRARASGSATVEASLNALGNVAGTRKDLDSAERFHRQALVLAERRAPESVDALLHNLGEDARLLGDSTTADALLRRALAMYDRLPEGSGREIAVANTLVSLAAVARDRSDFVEAERIARRALAIRETYEPDSLHLAEDREVLADILLARGQLAEARAAYEQILEVASRTVPDSELEARALHALGSIDRTEGRTERSAAMFGRAVDALDAQKSRVGGGMEAREQFSARYAGYYRDDAQALADLGRNAEAFAAVERSHARLLLAMLAERDLVFAASIPPALEEERARTDAEYDRTQRQLQGLSPKETARRQQLRDRLAELRAIRSDTIEKIKRASPRYGSLRYPRPLDLAAARAALDPGTLLLCYSVGRTRSLLFAVEPAAARGAGLTVFRLPLTEASLREAVAAHRTLVDLGGPAGASSRTLLARSRQLYDGLVRPADAVIGRYDRVVIVPDGPLYTVPWSSLARSSADGRPSYFVEWKAIHIAVSATVYAELEKARPATPRDPPVELAAFGDPRYPKESPPTPAARRGETDDPEIADLELRSATRGGPRFNPLPESRREVMEIAGLYAPRAVTYLGADATEENAKAIGTDVPFIHFACHAVVNERFPLDSALVFSIPEKPREGQDNGLLQAWEIFEQVRIDADLVTLSACESGLGKEMGGEGLIGLTRAFQYAGARTVLASLWKVEDKATAELMKRFYRCLKGGKTKDEALRSAQIDLIHSADYSNPRDWAAFQLNGDWK